MSSGYGTYDLALLRAEPDASGQGPTGGPGASGLAFRRGEPGLGAGVPTVGRAPTSSGSGRGQGRDQGPLRPLAAIPHRAGTQAAVLRDVGHAVTGDA